MYSLLRLIRVSGIVSAALWLLLLSPAASIDARAQGNAGQRFGSSQYRGQMFGYRNSGYGLGSRTYGGNLYSGYGNGPYVYGAYPYSTGYRYNYVFPYGTSYNGMNYNGNGYYYYGQYPGNVYHPYQSLWY